MEKWNRAKATQHCAESLWRYLSTLPGAELNTSYDTPSFKVKGKFMARLWKDGETLVLRIDFETVDVLLKSNPEVYFTTDHYKGYPAVLAHLSLANYDELCELLEQSWRMLAPTADAPCKRNTARPMRDELGLE